MGRAAGGDHALGAANVRRVRALDRALAARHEAAVRLVPLLNEAVDLADGGRGVTHVVVVHPLDGAHVPLVRLADLLLVALVSGAQVVQRASVGRQRRRAGQHREAEQYRSNVAMWLHGCLLSRPCTSSSRWRAGGRPRMAASPVELSNPRSNRGQ
jgi:hypothetical protein